jgi:hypothetical protein
MAPGTSMKGTVIANNAAIVMNAQDDTLEGRALSTTGAITIDGTMAYTPVGCGSAILTGPAAPDLLSTACYTLFTSNGSLSNSGVTNVTGDVGTNVGLTTGFNPLFVDGAVHPIPDGSTAAAASDLITVYDYLNLLPYDIELLYPAQFGQNLVLTPHTYLLNAATTFTDTLYLNAMGDTNAVFVFQINGALSTSTFANVVLTNGTKAKNVFWKVDGAVSINNFSDFKGTIICNNGAVSVNKGTKLNGRVLTTDGTLTTDSVNITIPPTSCGSVGIYEKVILNSNTSFFPNPMTTSLSILMNDATELNTSELKIYNSLGALVLSKIISEKVSAIETKFPSGIYYYKLISKDNSVQSGKLISQQ